MDDSDTAIAGTDADDGEIVNTSLGFSVDEDAVTPVEADGDIEEAVEFI